MQELNSKHLMILQLQLEKLLERDAKELLMHHLGGQRIII